MNESATVIDLNGLIEEGSILEVLDSSSVWAEGVVYIATENSLRWSDIPNNRILQFNVLTHTCSVYQDGVEFTNGRTLDHDGSVLQCSHGRRRIERDRDGQVTPVVESWNGARFNSPNDLVVGPDGAIWFTDPPYGIIFPREGHPGVREYGDHYVFRHDVSTSETKAVIQDVEEPNGLAFSPDGATLYVSDSSSLTGDPAHPGNAWIRAYDVTGTRCKNGREFAAIQVGVPDGLRVDLNGNVWTSAGDGVHVFSPDGMKLGSILVPETVANLCFGGPDGKTLFIAASKSIYQIRVTTTDANLTKSLGSHKVPS